MQATMNMARAKSAPIIVQITSVLTRRWSETGTEFASGTRLCFMIFQIELINTNKIYSFSIKATGLLKSYINITSAIILIRIASSATGCRRNPVTRAVSNRYPIQRLRPSRTRKWCLSF